MSAAKDAPDEVLVATQRRFWDLADSLKEKIQAMKGAEKAFADASGDLEYTVSAMKKIADWHGEDMPDELEAILEEHQLKDSPNAKP